MAAIEVVDLHKFYGSTHAVAGISFSVEEGEVLALLGPNGAGKTTTVEILEGHRARSGGSVEVLGYDPAGGGSAYRERIGIVLQSGGLDEELRVTEVLSMYGGFFPRRLDVDRVVEMVGLEEKRRARVKTLSGGQRRRLDLGVGIVGDPELIFLDEPTTGFDPSARRKAWDLVAGLRSLGKTILLTTHYMDEAQYLADRVVVVARGMVVAEGPPDSLAGRDTTEAFVRFRLPPGITIDDLPLPPGTARSDEDGVVIDTLEPTRVLHALSGWAVQAGYELEALTVTRPSLEDVYLQLVGEEGSGD